jgi:3',5'-cyclic AMP phosphodiesterase CpdA
MTTILQISDAHFGTERAPVVEALLELARSESPELVVFSGDITQRARRGQFSAARSFIDRLQPRALLAIPGNHDIPLFNLAARIFTPYANYSRAFGDDLEPVFESAQLLVIGVNTTRPQRHIDGEVSPEQIERVAQRLRGATSTQLRIVVVHQPVLAIRLSDKLNLLHGHKEAVPAWSAAGADIIMGGHIHLPYVRSLRTAFADLPRDVWAVQAGTSISRRIRGRIDNSVNLIRVDAADAPRACAVERWDYVPALGHFERHTSHSLTFDAPAGNRLAPEQ